MNGDLISTEAVFDSFVNTNGELILIVQDACMPAVQASTGLFPFELLFGVQPRLPID